MRILFKNNMCLTIIVKIFPMIIFIFGLIISFKDYIIIFQILISRIQKKDTIVIKHKEYCVQGKAYWVLFILVMSIVVSVSTFVTIICTWYYPEEENFIELLSLLLPLNYSLELSKISINSINKFISEHLSIEDMKTFKTADELKEALKDKKQYLSDQEAEELNNYFYKHEKLEWVKENGFKPKLYQKELEKRQKEKIK